MATKLKNLKVTKVDFVDEGANPDAHVPLKKSKEQETGSGKSPGVLHRLFSFIGKAAGMNQDEINDAVNEITKGESESFSDKFVEIQNGKIRDEIWEICFALQSSLVSILNDEDLDSTGTANAMQESLTEFGSVIDNCVRNWSNGKVASITKKNAEVTEADIELMNETIERISTQLAKGLSETSSGVAKGADDNEHENPNNEEGDDEMRIDKSKLSDAERAFLESIEKKAGVEDGRDIESTTEDGSTEATTPAEEPEPSDASVSDGEVQKSVTADDDIYKGLNPAVAKEIEELRKFRESAENRELAEIAKKYEVIGKKPEELTKTLKSLKAAGGTAYNDMIAVLDAAVDTVEKSGAFSEIGKSGHGSSETSAWAEADAKATELMKSRGGLSRAQALDEVLQSDPELAKRCEEEE